MRTHLRLTLRLAAVPPLPNFTAIGLATTHFAVKFAVTFVWVGQTRAMAPPTVLEFGALTLTRVLYLEAPVPPEAGGLTAAEIEAVPWNDERWSVDGQLHLAAAAWVVSSGDEHVVIDPFRNVDDILHDPASAADHQAAISAAFDAAGIPVSAITQAVSSHVEGIGMVAVRSEGTWVPFFPNARIRLGVAAIRDYEANGPSDDFTDAWRVLLDAGLVDPYEDGEELAPRVEAELTGDHNPGHSVIHLGEGPEATFVGHLAVSPLHLSTGPCIPQHPKPDEAWANLHRVAEDGRILFGPLWPSPGAGTWTGTEFVAVEA